LLLKGGEDDKKRAIVDILKSSQGTDNQGGTSRVWSWVRVSVRARARVRIRVRERVRDRVRDRVKSC
jgi:hypothetical protein